MKQTNMNLVSISVHLTFKATQQEAQIKFP